MDCVTASPKTSADASPYVLSIKLLNVILDRLLAEPDNSPAMQKARANLVHAMENLTKLTKISIP